MQLTSPDKVPRNSAHMVCRQSRLGTLAAALCFAAIFAGGPLVFIWVVQPSWLIGAPAVLFAILMLKLFAGDAINALRESNWVLQVTPRGLWINLRSFRHVDFPPARTSLFVAYDEIAGVREYVLKWTERDSRRRIWWTGRHLDIELRSPVPAEVRNEIAAERRRKVKRRYLGGLITAEGSRNHFPVSDPSEKSLRIGWRTKQDGVTPRLAVALRELATHVPVFEAVLVDRTDAKNLSPQEVDDLILAHAQAGDKTAAIKLVREHRGYGLTDAKRFVEELRG
jgi:hypothetical protein